MRQIILDTETTGLYPAGGDRIVEVAGVEMVDRRYTGKNLHFYIHPERDIPDEVVRVHGLTLDVLEEKGAPVFSAVGREISDFLRGADLVIHNAPFDTGFLDMEFARMGLPAVKETAASVTDTLVMARKLYPGQKNSLDMLCSRLGVDRSRRVLHGALIDCELLGDVYLAMTRSQYSLTDGLDAAAPVAGQIRGSGSAGLRHSPLAEVVVSAEDAAAHEAVLDDIEAEIRKPTLWRNEAGGGGSAA